MFKKIIYYKNIEDFIKNNVQNNSIFILYIPQNYSFDKEKLNKSNINYYGVYFPKVIYQNSLYDEGILACEVKGLSKVFLVEDIDEFKERSFNKKISSLMCLVDGKSQSILPFLEKLYSSVSYNSKIFGAGVGKYDCEDCSVVFTKKREYKNCALLVLSKESIGLGVSHGWSKLKGPYVITSSKKNRIKKFDYKNSLSTYKRVIEKDLKRELTQEEFVKQMKYYPLGIVKYQGDMILRSVRNCENKELNLVSDISENSIVNILRGCKKSISNSIRKSINKAIKEKESDNLLIFQCVSNNIYKNQVIKNDLDFKRVYGGALVLGEISNNSETYINYFNKTCVVGAL